MYKVYQSWEFVTVLGVGHRISKDCTQNVLESERAYQEESSSVLFPSWSGNNRGMRIGLERCGGRDSKVLAAHAEDQSLVHSAHISNSKPPVSSTPENP